MKKIIKECNNLLKKVFKKISLWTKLKKMDTYWYIMGGNCFEFLPPSFYYTHTEVEINRIINTELKAFKEYFKES